MTATREAFDLFHWACRHHFRHHFRRRWKDWQWWKLVWSDTRNRVCSRSSHGVYPAVMGWPTPSETLGKCGKVKIVAYLFGPFGTMTIYLGHQRTNKYKHDDRN